MAQHGKRCARRFFVPAPRARATWRQAVCFLGCFSTISKPPPFSPFRCPLSRLLRVIHPTFLRESSCPWRTAALCLLFWWAIVPHAPSPTIIPYQSLYVQWGGYSRSCTNRWIKWSDSFSPQSWTFSELQRGGYYFMVLSCAVIFRQLLSVPICSIRKGIIEVRPTDELSGPIVSEHSAKRFLNWNVPSICSQYRATPSFFISPY